MNTKEIQRTYRVGSKLRHVVTGELCVVLRHDSSGYEVKPKHGTAFHAHEMELVRA